MAQDTGRVTIVTVPKEGEEEELEFSRIGLDVLTVMYANRIKRECPGVELDYAKIAEEGKSTSIRYMKKYARSPRQKNEALTLLDLAENENAYYGDLKSEALPPELAGKQAQLVTRILPYKSAQFRLYHRVYDKLTSYPDPDAVCGYVIADNLNSKQDISKGIRFYMYDTFHRKWMKSGFRSPIPPGALVKDEFRMFKLGETTIPSPKCRLVFAETWGSPLAENYLARAHDPLRPDKKFEIWISAKLDGRRLAIEAIYTVEIL